MSHTSIFSHAHFRYLKWSVVLMLACVCGYVFHTPSIHPNGSTWLGYTLGSVGAALILWLMLYGIRRRSYSSSLGTVRGWLSAHVYLGLGLVLVATLHTGFEFGWNIHTLAYALMLAVVLSGVWGTVLYVRLPAAMGACLNGKTLEELGIAIADVDHELTHLSQDTPVKLQHILNTVQSGRIFAFWLQRFGGENPRCPTLRAVRQLAANSDDDTQQREQKVYGLLLKRLQLLRRIRRYVGMKAWLDLWLLFHVPLSFALLASLSAHVVSVFFYW